jgi:DnaJ-domain-containing protein 1
VSYEGASIAVIKSFNRNMLHSYALNGKSSKLTLRDYQIFKVRQIAFICLLFLIILPAICRAQNKAANQSLTVRGLMLPVDQISTVDSKNSRVVIQGKVYLVAKEQVDDLVVKQSLNDKTIVQKLNHGALVAFTDRSLGEDNLEYAVAGLRAMLLHAQISKDQWLEFLAINREHQVFIAALKQVVGDASIWPGVNSAIKIPILFELGIADPEWVSNSNPNAALSLSNEFHSFSETYVTEVIRARKFSRLGQIAHFLRELFGVEDPLFHQVRIIVEQLERFKQALQTRDAAALEITLLSLQKYQEQRQLLYPYFVEEIHRVARECIDSGAASQALALLALIDISFRTQTTHVLAKLCLERLSGGEALILDQPTVKRFLLALSQFDSSLKELFEKKLVAQFRAALSKQDIAQAERVISMLASARPDPNLANDQLRIEYAQILRDWGAYPQSQAQLRKVQTGLPFLVRLEIFTSDYLGISLFNFIALIISGALLAALIVIRLSAFIAARKQAAEQEIAKEKSSAFAKFQFGKEQQQSEDDTFSSPGFRRMQKVSPERAEYLRCLEVFGLAGDVSFKEIRQAYRQAVKTHHPDRQGEGLATDKFVDLNQTYERILEIRKILGLGDN